MTSGHLHINVYTHYFFATHFNIVINVNKIINFSSETLSKNKKLLPRFYRKYTTHEESDDEDASFLKHK